MVTQRDITAVVDSMERLAGFMTDSSVDRLLGRA